MSGDVLQFVREDDFVEYFIFPDLREKAMTIEEEDLLLNSLLLEIQPICMNYCKGYIWHKDEFKIVSRNSKSKLLSENYSVKGPVPIHFYGITHYGDNVQDEWFIVSILIELTKAIKGLTARIVDSDGEFLLIEAADYLPQWATPETCEQRVFIHNGSIHIIPWQITNDNDTKIESCSDEDEDSPEVHIITINEALSYINMNSKQSLANDTIQQSIKSRIVDFPFHISNHLHRTTVYVPVAIAKLLESDPQLIAPAVQAFCNRDSIDMKVCRAMKYFPPENRTYCSVLFTKCLYAMVMHNKYLPDRKIGWKLPDINSSDYKAQSLGVKIACGFEILASQAKSDTSIEGDKAWVTYLKNLNEKGYFQGLIEKSEAHNKLLEEAKEYYIQNRDSMKTAPMNANKILKLMKTIETGEESCINETRSSLPPDDNDNWLNITPAELDDMMKERYGHKCKIFTTNGNADASDLTGKLSEFLDHRSGLEGVEFSDDIDLNFDIPVKPKRGIFKNKDKKNDKLQSNDRQNIKVDFDPEAFACAIQNILDFKIPDENWDQSSDSEMSEYNDCEVSKDEDSEPSKFRNYMDEMDKELASTTIGKSFKLKQEKGEDLFSDDNFDEVEDFKPVNIDINTLKSMMKSYEGEMGSSGPASTLLGSIGVRLEPDMHVE